MQPALKLAALISVAAAFAACDGANQGVQIGTGQNPDPVVIDFPIAYVKQPIPVDDNGEFEQQDLREQISFQIGGNLYFRDRASPSALEVNITEPIIADQGDVRDVEILKSLDLGVRAMAPCPVKTHKRNLGDADVPVRFGGVTFAPGGWVYADDNGIIFSEMSLE